VNSKSAALAFGFSLNAFPNVRIIPSRPSMGNRS